MSQKILTGVHGNTGGIVFNDTFALDKRTLMCPKCGDTSFNTVDGVFICSCRNKLMPFESAQNILRDEVINYVDAYNLIVFNSNEYFKKG